MKAGDFFERDGITYVIKTGGTAFRSTNKDKCILPKGERNCVSIDQAKKQGLIALKSDNPREDLFEGPNTLKGADHSTNEQKRNSKSETQRTCNQDGTYYMSVDQLRCQVFLAHGLIFPSVYDAVASSSDFEDSQSAAPSELTLFSEPQPIPKNQVQLRLLLRSAEVVESSQFEGGLRLSFPLPVSRVVEIQVGEHVDDLGKYIAGLVKPDVPIPSHLFTKAECVSHVEQCTAPTSTLRANSSSSVAKSIREFDRQMGALAFLRNASRYLSASTGKYSDYPSSFFALAEALMGGTVGVSAPGSSPSLSLQTFRLEPSKDIGATAVLSLVTSDLAYIDKDKARDCAKKLFDATGERDDLAQAFAKLFKNNDYRAAIRELQNPDIPVSAAILAVLYKFSNKSGDERRSVKHRLHEDWTSVDRMEAALCALGAYYGYTALDARETRLYSVHPLILPLVEDSPLIKFTLATRFERRLIESVYQRCFFGGADLKDATGIYDSKIVRVDATSSSHRNIYLKDESYSVQDLAVRRYSVSRMGKLLDRLRTFFRGFVDESSETGRYLMASCFFHAESYELSKDEKGQTLRFRISTEKLIKLISDCRINVNENVLVATLEADSGVRDL